VFRVWKRRGGGIDFKPPTEPFRLRDLPPRIDGDNRVGWGLVALQAIGALGGVPRLSPALRAAAAASPTSAPARVIVAACPIAPPCAARDPSPAIVPWIAALPPAARSIERPTAAEAALTR
jgi:hypothetical protein